MLTNTLNMDMSYGLRFVIDSSLFKLVYAISQTMPPLANRRHHGYYSHMEKATVSKLKNNLSAYLRKVRAGHAVVIYDRDAPIARLERIESSGSGSDRLALLCARGLVRPPATPLSPAGLQSSLNSALPRKASLSAALRADRDEGR